MDGTLAPPDVKTLEIDLIGVFYSKSDALMEFLILQYVESACQLALHYLVPERETLTPDSIKALILIGSLSTLLTSASWGSTSNTPRYINVVVVYPRPGFLQYTTAKHGVLGLQRSLSPLCTAKGIRSGSVHPGYVGAYSSSVLQAMRCCRVSLLNAVTRNTHDC